MRQVKEERLGAVALDEVDGALGVVLRQFRLQDRVLDHRLVRDHLHRAHVVGVENAVVLVEALFPGQVLLDMAEMPLSDRSRGVAARLQSLGDRDLRGRKADIVAADVG